MRDLVTVRGKRGIVTAPHWAAAEAGASVLRDGGTAAEASVATAACLAVVYPHMTGIGGDAFWLIAEPDGTTRAVHGCGAAAGVADLALYDGMDAVPWRGPLAANTVAGALSAWEQVLVAGTLPLGRVLADAIRFARDGVAVTGGGAAIIAAKYDELAVQPGGWRRTFAADGPPPAGTVLRQPALAATLERIATAGIGDFYDGALANDIAADLAELGSPVSRADLAGHRATLPEPLHVRIDGATLLNAAPPTQGVASLMILALFDRLAVGEGEGFDHLHGLIEATKRAFLWRDEHCGDPAFAQEDAQALLDDADRLDAIGASIDRRRAMPWPHVSQPGDTCWFGAADDRGQVVSAIQSTYFEFGSGLVLPRTGVTWQNRGASFRLAPTGWNALRPGRQPFHTLNPAIARFDDGRVMAYGTMGGEGQPQTQAAIFTRYARFGLDLQDAITRPRWLLGRTWGDDSVTLKLEDRFDPKLVDQLRAAGHDVELLDSVTATMGHAGAIVRHPDGRLEGATDPRSDGRVVAW